MTSSMTLSPALSPPALDELCINTLRFLAVDMVQKANSGHPGLPLGSAAMAYTLWDRFLNVNPRDPAWPDRDRFVLSPGHGCALLYALLHVTGFDLPLAELKSFRQWGSRTPGHPEYGKTPGVEATTGPLGQGFGNAVGMAIAEVALAARFNRPDHAIVDHDTYVLVSDGDLMEGVSSEAASLAGHLRLGKLMALYADNLVTLGGSANLAFTEDRQARFAAYGWHVQRVENGNDVADLTAAIEGGTGGKGPSVVHRCPHPHRLRQSPQARHVGGPRFAPGRGRSAPDQGKPGLAGRTFLRHSRGGPGTLPGRSRIAERRGRRSGSPGSGPMRRHIPNWPRSSSGSCSGNSRRDGTETYPRSARIKDPWLPGPLAAR